MSTTPESAELAARAAALIAAVEETYEPAPLPTAYRDPSPLPTVGTAAPVAQPGRPPMSQRATDASALMLAAGAATVPVGGTAALVLWALGGVDPVAIGLTGASAVGALLALGRVIARAGQATAPVTHHHHYRGPVHQDHRQSITRGVIATTKTVTKSR